MTVGRIVYVTVTVDSICCCLVESKVCSRTLLSESVGNAGSRLREAW